MRRITFFIGIITLLGVLIFALSVFMKKQNIISDKISIVTTLFPEYDMAKAIGGDKTDITLLLPPGVEAHTYEPKASDIVKINNAHIFIYTGEFMEPWAQDIIQGADKKIRIVDASVGVDLLKESDEHDGVDPHIWLDFGNAKKMAENIATALFQADPQNTEYYQNNLKIYQDKLTALDNAYKNTLSTCKTKTVIYGGHYAFGYMIKRYGLEYVAVQGFSPDAEPRAKDMIELTEQVKKDNVSYIFYEELTSPKIAETLASETKTKLLLLNAAHNLSKEDYEVGATVVSIMEENLKNLSIGLDCQK